MKQSPYTISEARAIAADYQHLVGQSFGSDQPGSIIDCVAVAPFDQLSKSRFIIYYLLFEDAEMALTNEYKGLLFDVIVMAGSAEKSELQHENIDTWLSKSKEAHEPVLTPVFAGAAY